MKIGQIKLPTPYKKKPISAHNLLLKTKLSSFLKSGLLTATSKGTIKKG